MTNVDFTISRLGVPQINTPLRALLARKCWPVHFVSDQEQVPFDPNIKTLREVFQKGGGILSVERAGPREKIYFDPQKTKAGIVTCGGLCPGINDVIREIVMQLYYRYGTMEIYGFRYGYEGLIETYGHEVKTLTPDTVAHIHRMGGSILSSSRGQQDSSSMVNYLKKLGVNMLFVIGGDGTLRGALDIAEHAEKVKYELSVIGIPKTVDNDILHIDRSFGFETAFSEATKSIISAHAEAKGVKNGVGLVKLMGRSSGFIACFAALAMNDVNFVIIPEVPVELEGKKGFLEVLKKRLEAKKHAVIVVAEGSMQDVIAGEDLGKDASGNIRFKDAGIFLRNRINAYFKNQNMEVNIKYIDPSYIIRSIEASPLDNVYCLRLAQNAVHAAMSGRTKMVVGLRHGHFVHLPMALLAQGRRQVDADGELWQSVLSATGQPAIFE